MTRKKAPRLIRSLLATLYFCGITLLLLDVGGALVPWLSWMAGLQFLPAVLAVNLGIVFVILGLTLFLGRVYCSVICPLGVWQDLVSRLRSRFKPHRFSYLHNPRLVRALFLLVAVLGAAGVMRLLLVLLAPYSNWGRIVTNLFQPLWGMVLNGISSLEDHFGIYRTFPVSVWVKSLSGLVVAALMFCLFSALAWWKGRIWCNTACPVGTILGSVSAHALIRPDIDYDKCIRCRKCERNCKSSCIDIHHHHIDYSRCVSCYDCIAECPVGAFSLFPAWRKQQKSPSSHHAHHHPEPHSQTMQQPDEGRRALLATLALALPLETRAQKTDGGLAFLRKRSIPQRKTAPVPAGARSIDNLAARCTACGLCISKCPENVLRPSAAFGSLFQASMAFDRGWCRPDCNLCSTVCPTGAILPITPEAKSATHIGHAVWLKTNCLPVAEGVACGNCARHCPVGAIKMVRIKDSGLDSMELNGELRIPVVNETRCLGCGACEYL